MQVPLLGKHCKVFPFLAHWQVSRQSSPYDKNGHGREHVMPFHPILHLHFPVRGWQLKTQKNNIKSTMESSTIPHSLQLTRLHFANCLWIEKI